jgi:hypothetical protein
MTTAEEWPWWRREPGRGVFDMWDNEGRREEECGRVMVNMERKTCRGYQLFQHHL